MLNIFLCYVYILLYLMVDEIGVVVIYMVFGQVFSNFGVGRVVCNNYVFELVLYFFEFFFRNEVVLNVCNFFVE